MMLSDEKIEDLWRGLVETPQPTVIVFARAIESAVLEARGEQDKTVTVSYDLSSAEVEGAIRGKLIKLGWTPPGYEAQEKQEPHPFSAERVTYHKAAPVVQQQQEPVAYVNHNLRNSIEWEEDYAELPNVTKLYAAPIEQPDMVLVPREPTEAMLAVIRNERGAYGTGEALYADLIAAAMKEQCDAK